MRKPVYALLLSSTVVLGTMAAIAIPPSAVYAHASVAGASPLTQLPMLDIQAILRVAWDWLTLAVLLFWLGILITERLIITRMEQGIVLLAVTEKQSRSLQWLSLSAVLIGECVSLILHFTRYLQDMHSTFLPGLVGQFITTTFYSQLWCVRAILLLVALALLYLTNHPQTQPAQEQREQRQTSREQSITIVRRIVTDAVTTPSSQTRITRDFTLSPMSTGTTGPLKAVQPEPIVPVTKRTLNLLWFVLAAAILLTLALSNSAVAIAPLHISAVVMTWLYLAALSSWFGGLAYTVYILLPVVRRENLAEQLIAFLRRLSDFVLVAIAIIFVSGIFLSEATLPNIHQLLTTPYGRILLVTIILTVLLSLFSLYILFMFRTRLARQALLLPVVGAELPARRTRLSALEQTELHLKYAIEVVLIGIVIVLFCLSLMAFYIPR